MFYQQFEKYFYMKLIITIVPTDLVANSLLYSFCPFLQTKSKNPVFSKLVVWYKQMFLFFVYSESRSASKPYRIQQTFIKEFSYMLFLFILQFHDFTVCYCHVTYAYLSESTLHGCLNVKDVKELLARNKHDI